MKTTIQTKLILIGTSGLVLAAASLLAKPPGTSHKGGTDILHFFASETLTNTGVVTNATGQVFVGQNQQGKANNQRFDLVVRQLDTNSTYELMAITDANTNFTDVAGITTDAGGNAALHYRSNENGNGNGHGHGGQNSLPPVLNPVSQIQQIALFNGSTQAVLTADLTRPGKLEYLVKRDLSTNNVNASLRIQATVQQTQFRLEASGLNPTNDYFLVLNGGIVQTNTADANGKLRINSFLQNPPEILDIRTLALWDSSSNVVLSTSLP